MALSMLPEDDAREPNAEAASPFALQDDLPSPATPVVSTDLIEGDSYSSISRRLDRLEQALIDLHANLAEQIANRLRQDVPTARPEPKPAPVPVAEIVAGPPPQPIHGERESAPDPSIETARPPRGWLWWEILRDGGRTLYMLIDSRYRMSWSTRIVVIGLLAVILLPQWWNPLHFLLGFLPFLQEMLDKAVVVILCFFLYKVLSRELLLYKEFLEERTRRR